MTSTFMTCAHKQRHTEKLAKKLVPILSEKRQVFLRCYRCPECGWWHLTKQPLHGPVLRRTDKGLSVSEKTATDLLEALAEECFEVRLSEEEWEGEVYATLTIAPPGGVRSQFEGVSAEHCVGQALEKKVYQGVLFRYRDRLRRGED